MSVITGDSTDRTPRRFTAGLEDGQSVVVEITGDPDNHARIAVQLEDGPRWTFTVSDDVAVPDVDASTDELPTWIEPLLHRLGLEGVDA
ncbi:hypothetical protein [Natrarchaeobaculum sulfurireducens]|uniref:Uncharacterized protein n=1 Tax=Natrarchaeobaculum sulfurireducens TaxID=2044521 RepID=A0A346PS52_9EURY|nr:hypothetical protein [Natrarchaeobaculum sulfurireducens]AXR82347.1 hypothetical protein AArcMg_2353 [Natrarchaeobaculum sulfurireducens]